MVETAAHLTDHVFPRLPVRQWVLSVPKRLRYFMQRDGAVLNMLLRIFLRVIAQSLSANCPGAADVNKAAQHVGAVAFIHRFGSSLNGHVHFHVCVVDGVFEEVPGEGDAAPQASAPGIVFHPASAIDSAAVAQVQTDLRRRILRAFVGRGLIEQADAKEMLGYQHSGFSVDAGVCIEADDRAALVRLLRYCARPPFARCAGTEFAHQGCGDGHGTTAHEANRASHHGRGRAWSGAAGPSDPTHARTCATQTFTGALPVGGVDRQNLRSVPAAVPDVWWANAPDRVHY